MALQSGRIACWSVTAVAAFFIYILYAGLDMRWWVEVDSHLRAFLLFTFHLCALLAGPAAELRVLHLKDVARLAQKEKL